MKTAHPDICDRCLARGQVVHTDKTPKGYTRRRHRCPLCGHEWSSYQSRLNPKFSLGRIRRNRHSR